MTDACKRHGTPRRWWKPMDGSQEQHERELATYRRRSHAMAYEPTLAVDFDGVIHSYTSPWTAPTDIPDPPVPGAVDWLNRVSQEFKVIIFTTRGKTQEGQRAVSDWLALHGYQSAAATEVTAEKPPALIYLDDRAVRFDGEHFPTADEIRAFKPWNKP